MPSCRLLIQRIFLLWSLSGTLFAQNWSLKTPIQASVDFNSVYFTSDQTGFAAGTAGNIYKTTDGGLSWSSLTSGTTENLTDIFFVNNSTGFVVGANGTIRKTTNGGTAWTAQSATGTSTTTFNRVRFINANNGYAVGTGGKVIKTTNGGTNWTVLTSGTTNDLVGAHFISISTGFIGGTNGLLRKTTDGGSTWSTLTTSSTETLNDISFVSANTGFIAGTGGLLMKTDDGGTTWTDISDGFSLEYKRIFFTDANNGYLASSSGYTRVTTDGGANWISFTVGSTTFLGLSFSSAYTGYMVGTSGLLAKYQSEYEPEYQASDMTFDEVYSTSMRVLFTASPDLPTGYLAVMKTGSMPSGDPVDGIPYTDGQTIGDGTVVYTGASPDFSLSLLSPGTTYYYKVYAYNGSGTAINYKVDNPLTGNRSTYFTGQPWTDLTGVLTAFPRSVSFYDANNGGAAGGYYLKTTADGGTNWTDGFFGNGDSYYGIHFVTATTAYVVGFGNGGTRVIRRTVNGGATWLDQVRAISSYGLRKVDFATSTIGVVVGDDGNILRTTNGTSWTPVTSGTANSLLGIHFVTSTVGYISGASGTVLKTVNSGANWSPLPMVPVTANLNDVFFVDPSRGFAVGAGGTIIRTVDGGSSWELLTSGTTAELTGVHFTDTNTGYAVGLAGTVLKTTDGGTSWYDFPTGISVSNDLYDVVFPTPYVGYAVGQRVFKIQSVPEPTFQPSAIAFSTIQPHTVDLSFNAAGDLPSGYLVLRKADAAPTGVPLDGITYAVGSSIGDGVVAYVGSDLTFEDIDLTVSTNYFYRVFSYNRNTPDASINYKISSPPTGDFYTLATKPGSQPSALVFSSITASSVNLSFTAAAGTPSGYMILRKAGSDPTSFPVDGVNYSVGQTIGDGTIAYIGSATNFTDTGLTGGQHYYYKVLSYNGSGVSTNYLTASPLSGNIDFGIPTITSFSPTTGPVGTVVTITGTNISATPGNNSVSFGAVRGTVTAATTSSLTVAVPVGASYQPLSVTLTTSGLSAFSKKPFVVTFPSSGVGVDAASFTTDNAEFATPDAPNGIVARDLDGDGKADLIVTATENNAVAVYRNVSSQGAAATFSSPRLDLSTGASFPYAVTTSDLDGDGLADIIVSNANSSSLSIFKNTSTLGALSFAPRQDLTTGSVPYTIATGDLNQDGRPEIVVPNYSSNSVSIFRNISTLGVIGFAPKTDLTTGLQPEGVAVGDIDGDGKNDIAVVNLNSVTVSLFRNTTTSSISFAAKFDFALTGTPGPIAMADVDGDNKLDLITGSNSSDNISLFRNTATSGIINASSLAARVDLASGSNPTDVVVADLDGDGKPEISTINNAVLSNSISVFRNNSTSGTISLAAKVDFETGTMPSGLAIADIDGDGKLDLATCSENTSKILIHRNLIAGPAINAVSPASGNVGAEVTLNGSGFSSTPATNVVYVGGVRAAVTTASATSLSINAPVGASNQPISVTLNGLTAYSQAPFNVKFTSSLTIDGSSFAAPVDVTTGNSPYGIAVADIDGDGRNDAVVSNYADNTISVFRNTSTTGAVTYATASTFATGTGPYGLAIDDVDGDGKKDIVVTNSTANTVSVFRNTSSSGSITLSAKVDFTTTSSPVSVAMSDLDGDGRVDLVAACALSNKLSLFRNISSPGSITSGSFATRIDLTTGSLPTGVAAGDVTGDGKRDLVVTNSSANTVSVIRNLSVAGLFSFDNKIDYSTGSTSQPNGVAIGDLTADGKPDLAVANSGTAKIALYRNTTTSGNVSFDPRIESAVASGPYAVVISDFDGDALPDVTSPGVTSAAVSVLRNTSSNGSLSVASAFNITGLGVQPRSIAAADMDSDGKPDLIMPAASSNKFSTLRNTNILPTPTASAATSVTQTGFVANWSSVSAATNYQVDVSTDNFATLLTGYSNLAVAGTSLAVANLSPGASYKYRVRSNNSSGSSSSSTSISITTLPGTPVISAPSSITQTGFSLSWTAGAGATGYRVDIALANDFNSFSILTSYNNLNVAGTSLAVSGLSAGTQYFCRVRATNATGASPDSGTASVMTVPSNPVVSSATAVSTNGFTANWSASANASNYLLYVSTDNFSTHLAGYNGLVVINTSSTLVGLAPGTAYQYRVKSNNGSGVSGFSSAASVTTITTAPVANGVTNVSANGFTAEWNTVAGAEDYRIDVSTDNGFGSFTGSYFNQQAGTGTSFSITGLNAGTYYYFRVRGANLSGSSLSSNTIQVLTLPAAPVAHAATSVTGTSMMIGWDASTSATEYRIDVSLASENFASFVAGYENLATSTTSLEVALPTPGIEYVLRVRAVNASGESTNSNTIITLARPAAPSVAAPTGIEAGAFTANWVAVPGVLGYYLDVSSNNFSSFLSGYENYLLSGVSKEISGLSAGTTYQYRVRSYNSSGSSVNSDPVDVITIPPAPITVSSSAFTPTSFTANWLPATGADSYFIDVSSDLNFASGSLAPGFDNLAVTGTSVSVTNLTPGTVYYYRVRAENQSGTSVSSNTTSSTNIPGAPVLSGVTDLTTSGFTVNWATTPGADGYFLDLSTNNFISYVSVFNNFSVSGNSYPLSGLTPGTEYQFRLRAANSSGTSANSLSSSVLTLPLPPVITPTTAITATSFKANWTPALSASSYRLDVSEDDFTTFVSGFEDLAINTNNVTVTGLSAGTTYHIRVRAVNGSGVSAVTATVDVITVPPAPEVTPATQRTTAGFVANWNAAKGADEYIIDVSVDNFETLEPDFSGKLVGAVLSTSINGLNPGKSYQYRVRSVNTSGISESSASMALLTLQTEPNQIASNAVFTDVTTSSFNLQFQPGGDASGSLVVRREGAAPTAIPSDGQAYNTGEVIGDAEVVYAGDGTELAQMELTPGSVYFYRLISFSGSGTSSNYLTDEVLEASQATFCSAPLAIAATQISQSAFLANWQPSTGAAGYVVDVSRDEFASFISGYEGSPSETTSMQISGLPGGVIYQYRVRAVNTAGESSSSDTVSVLTIPETPTGLTASLINSTTFKLTWDQVEGADNFFVDLSPDNFVTFTLSDVAIPGPTSFEFQGLSPLTTYRLRLRAANASGASPSSEVLVVTTLPAGGVAPLKIETPVYSQKMTSAPVSGSVELTGGLEPKTLTMNYRKITATDFEEQELTLREGSTSFYDFTITTEMADEIGAEFFFSANDGAGTIRESQSHYFVYKAVETSSASAIPFTQGTFNGKASTYQMFSIPYVLDDANIANLFDPALNGADATRWKLLHYQNGAYASYPEQLKKIELGKGYWFNTIESDFEIKLSQATVGQVTQASNFQMTLERGWNQLGDPYPFHLNWNQVVTANPDAGLNSLWMFEDANYVKKDVLEAWRGGFVFSDNGGSVVFPLTARSETSGRMIQVLGTDIDERDWQMVLELEAAGVRGRSSIGMSEEATDTKDRWDEIALPRFLDYVDMTTEHREFFSPYFSGDIVHSKPSYSWTFYPASNQRGSVQIHWDQSTLQGARAGLFLLDVTNHAWVDMRLTDVYEFDRKEGHEIRIIFDADGEFNPGISLVGTSYPNPFRESVSIPVLLERDGSFVELQVMDMMGRSVGSVQKVFSTKGLNELHWSPDTNIQIDDGLLLYRVRIDGTLSPARKMIRIN